MSLRLVHSAGLVPVNEYGEVLPPRLRTDLLPEAWPDPCSLPAPGVTERISHALAEFLGSTTSSTTSEKSSASETPPCPRFPPSPKSPSR